MRSAGRRTIAGMIAATVLALSLGAAVADSPKAPREKEVRDAIRRGVALLLDQQESLGELSADAQGAKQRASGAKREWPYEGVYRVGGQIPVGYRVGGTAIVAQALVDAAEDGKLTVPARQAIERGLDFVLEGLADPRMTAEFEKGYDVRGWGHAYALSFLLRLRAAGHVPKSREQEVEAAIDSLVSMLQATEIKEQGGWNYSRPNGHASSASTFMTAPTLQFLFEARAQGEDVDAAVIERALKTLEDARLESGAFQYGTSPTRRTGKGFEAVEGAIGRMAVCETTLLLAGRGSVERVRESLDAFFEHWEWLEKRRKQTGTHVPPFMIAPYYFYYAHRYTAQAIEMLPEAERPAYREKLYALLWQVREQSGGWNDRVFPRSEAFGTAMTLSALREPALGRPAGWTPPTAEAKTGDK